MLKWHKSNWDSTPSAQILPERSANRKPTKLLGTATHQVTDRFFSGLAYIARQVG